MLSWIPWISQAKLESWLTQSLFSRPSSFFWIATRRSPLPPLSVFVFVLGKTRRSPIFHLTLHRFHPSHLVICLPTLAFQPRQIWHSPLRSLHTPFYALLTSARISVSNVLFGHQHLVPHTFRLISSYCPINHGTTIITRTLCEERIG